MSEPAKRWHTCPVEAQEDGWSKAWFGETKSGEVRVYAYMLPYRQRAYRAYWRGTHTNKANSKP